MLKRKLKKPAFFEKMPYPLFSDIMINILKYLPVDDITNVKNTSKSLNHITQILLKLTCNNDELLYIFFEWALQDPILFTKLFKKLRNKKFSQFMHIHENLEIMKTSSKISLFEIDPKNNPTIQNAIITNDQQAREYILFAIFSYFNNDKSVNENIINKDVLKVAVKKALLDDKDDVKDYFWNLITNKKKYKIYLFIYSRYFINEDINFSDNFNNKNILNAILYIQRTHACEIHKNLEKL